MKKAVSIALFFLSVLSLQIFGQTEERTKPVENPNLDNKKPSLIVQTGHTTEVEKLWFTPDEQNLISQSNDRIIIWDVKNKIPLRSIEKENFYDLSATAGVLATKSLGDKITFWEIKTGKKLYQIENEECAFNLSGKYLACKNNLNVITARDVKTNKILREFEFEGRTIQDFSFGWNDTIIISSLPKEEPAEGEPRNFLEVYDVKKAEPLFAVHDQKYWGTSNDGKLLTAEDTNNNFVIYNLDDKYKKIFEEKEISYNWELTADNKYFTAIKDDGTLYIWDIATHQVKFTKPNKTYIDISFVPGNRYIYENEDFVLQFYDLQTGKLHTTIDGLFQGLSNDGKFVLVSNSTKSEKSTYSLWNIETRKKVFSTAESDVYIDHLGFSNDGKMLTASFEIDSFLIWDTNTGKEKTISQKGEISAPKTMIDSPTIPSRIATMQSTGGLSDKEDWRLYISLRTNNKKLVINDLESYSKDHSIKFINRDKTLVRGLSNGVIDFWDVVSSKKLQTLEKHASSIRTDFTEDKKSLVIQDGYFDKTWNYEKGGFTEIKEATDSLTEMIYGTPTEETEEITGNSYDLYEWGFEDEFNRTGNYYLKEKESGKTIFQFENIEECEVSYDAKYFGCYKIIERDESNTYAIKLDLEIYDIKTKKLLFTFTNASQNYGKNLFDEERGWLFVERSEEITDEDGETSQGDSRLEIWDLQGKQLFVSRSSLRHYEIDASGENLVLGFDDGLEWHNLKTGVKKTFEFEKDFYVSIDRTTPYASLSGDHIAFTDQDYENRIYVWNDIAGRIFWRTEHSSKIISVEFSPDEKFLFTAGEDGTVKVWDIFKEKLVLTLIPLDEKDWVVVDADGRFDASPDAAKLMEWRVGDTTISFEQLKQRYYEPNLWQKVLGFSKEPLRNVSAFEDVLLPPEVLEEKLPNENAKSTLRAVRLRNKGGGIGRVQVFVNGREFIEDARDEKLKANPNIDEYVLKFSLENASFISGEKPDVKVVAWNYDKNATEKFKGYASSRGVEVFYDPAEEDEPVVPPTLYAIIGGVSDYNGSELDLRFAAKDAEDMFQAIKVGGKNLFGVEKMNIKLLATGENPNAIQPTKENFQKAYAEFAKLAQPNDIFFVYLSGHGITLSQSDTYYYLTKEATTTDKQALSMDSELLKSSTINSEELTAWHKSVKAQKQVLILDTCAAGALGKIIEKKDLSTDAKRALENMKDRVGFHVLMGSAADAVSYEASQYGQGLLTYSLLEGIKGAALLDDKKIDISKLFNYAADRVPQLAKNIGGIQRPEIRVPEGGTSFAVGLINNETDKRAIPLANVKPLILRPVLQNKQLGFDNLKITLLFKNKIREESFITERGRDISTLVFVDTDEMPDAVIPAGNYTIEGDTIKLTVNLVRNNEAVKTLNIEADKNDLNAAIEKLFEEISNALKDL